MNSGEESSTVANIADDITVALSLDFRFQINGGDPPLPGNIPLRGDRLIVNTPAEVNVYSDLNDPPNVSVTSSIGGQTTEEVVYHSIEHLTLVPGNGIVNILGDNNNTAPQQDEFIIQGADILGPPDGVNEYYLLINGSNPIGVSNVDFTNVFGFQLDDDLTIDPYADDRPRGWDIDVVYDGGTGDDSMSGRRLRGATHPGRRRHRQSPDSVVSPGRDSPF